MKKQKGITLIALIITIIVMLILVAVTINVAVNGGLFEKAKTAKEDTQKEVDKEALLSAVVANLKDDGTVNFGTLDLNLPEGIEGSNGNYQNKKTGAKYKVDAKTGKITENSTSPNPLAGKSFVIGGYLEFESDDEIGTMEFTENSAKFNGIDFGYTYNPTTKEVQLTLVMGEQEQTIPGNYLYEIKQNGNTVNWLFLFNSNLNGQLIVSTTNEATGLLPFEGKFKNKEDENDIIEFTAGEKYGSVKGYGNYSSSTEYCYIEQINTFYFSDNGREECTYTTDSNGSIDTITIDNVVYEKVNE